MSRPLPVFSRARTATRKPRVARVLWTKKKKSRAEKFFEIKSGARTTKGALCARTPWRALSNDTSSKRPRFDRTVFVLLVSQFSGFLHPFPITLNRRFVDET